MSTLPPVLQRHPLPRQWLSFGADGCVQVRCGKAELGQGIHTALAQIVADELGLAFEQVGMRAPSTDSSPDEGVTSGSLSVQDSGSALRWVCGTMRERLQREAARRLGVAAVSLRLHDGRWHAPDGRSLTHAELAHEALLAEPLAAPGHAPAALPRRWVGRSVPPAPLQALVFGAAGFIHDLNPPGLLHGRVLHPPQHGDRLQAADTAVLRASPGVLQVRRDGDLLGVLAHDAAAADAALKLLRQGANYLAAVPAEPPAPAPRVVDERGTPAAPGARTLEACYSKPWIAHAALAPSCALAAWNGQRLEVWTHSQGIHNLRRDLALAFALEPEAVTVHHVPGAGCYGHNGADDVAFDAAWLARHADGAPVRVVWNRRDELRQAPLGPAMRIELQADLDPDGAVVHWRHDLWSPGHSARPGRSATPALLGAWQRAAALQRPAAIDMPAASGGGAERNAVPGYALPGWRVRCHRVADAPVRSSALRSLGAFGNVFAIESFVDEIAHAGAVCPLQWRERHLQHDARALAVLRLAAERGGWAERRRGDGRGMGLALARYKGSGAWCAVLAEVEVAAALQVRRLCIAADVGLAVNPEGVVQQLEGGAVQATSWTLLEQVPVRDGRVHAERDAPYPTLRFTQVPQVQVHLVPSEAASLGAGEAALGPTAAAIANALFDALGVRVRELPLTPERIAATIDASHHESPR